MASNNPYSFPQNFMDLLNSQQDRSSPQTLPPISPPLQLSSSPLPQYSAQFSEPINLDENSPEDHGEARRRWSAPEDVLLISAWLNTSKDPIVGNEQKAGAFWERIAAYYASSEAVADKPKRGASQCKQRWKKINESVNKFVGCYSQASSRRSSGQSEDDVLQLAYKLYFNDQKAKFTLEHAWRELKNDQKWCSSFNSKGKDSCKRTKLDDGSYSSSSNTESRGDEECTRRPPGVKASKGKGKKAVTTEERDASSLVVLERMWEIKEKDIAGRERLSKQKLLDSLIAKSELSENELTLKNKLIAEMLG